MSRPVVTLAALALVLAAGCSSPTTKRLYFPREELARLDGFRAGQTVELETEDGSVVPVTASTTLRFTVQGAEPRKLRCNAIEVDGLLFSCVDHAGSEQRLDLERTDPFVLIRTSRTSWRRTALYVLGVYLLAGLVAAAAGA
jgi:hypothetical protein